MDPSTGTFISMDSYQGSIYDPVSLHKYLYANANPVTYVDPSGYNSNTLVAQMITLDIKCRLITQAYQVAFKTLIGMVVGGALGALDSYLGGNDLQQIQEDALISTLLGGACGGAAAIFARFVKFYPKLKVLLKIEPIAGVILGYFGIKDSLDNGHGEQAIFRAILTLPSIIGSAAVLKDIKLPKFGSKGGRDSRNRIGNPVNPMEKTYEMALNPELYANEVAKKYGITRERVRQIELKVLNKLKKASIVYDFDILREKEGKNLALSYRF